MKRLFVVLVLCLLLSLQPVSAHSGDTDRYGGHYDSDTGEYHYHHGQEAHQHHNGECPYNFAEGPYSYSGGSAKIEKDPSDIFQNKQDAFTDEYFAAKKDNNLFETPVPTIRVPTNEEKATEEAEPLWKVIVTVVVLSILGGGLFFYVGLILATILLVVLLPDKIKKHIPEKVQSVFTIICGGIVAAIMLFIIFSDM